MAQRMVMHPFKPSLDGTDLTDFKDPHGNPLFTNMVTVVKQQGAGFVDYYWEKPGSEMPIEKKFLSSKVFSLGDGLSARGFMLTTSKPSSTPKCSNSD